MVPNVLSLILCIESFICYIASRCYWLWTMLFSDDIINEDEPTPNYIDIDSKASTTLLSVGLSDDPLLIRLIRSILSFCFSSNCEPFTELSSQGTCAHACAEGPLLAFSCGGMLWGYYVGVIAFFRDHFDLHKSRVCLSGISSGCMATIIILLDLTIEQAFESVVDNADFFRKSWLVSASQAVDALIHQVKLFGITDEILKQKYIKYGGADCIHFGVSVFCPFTNKMAMVQHHLLNHFDSLKQLFYAASCSFRTLPFLRTLGYYDGYYCVDGALTSWYSIPTLYRHRVNQDKIIRVGIVSNSLQLFTKSEICPNANFYPHEFVVVARDLKQHFVRFNRGYKDAARFGHVLKNYIQKGLIWSNTEIDCNIFGENDDRNMNINVKQWNCHVDNRIKQWNERLARHMETCEGKKQ